MGREFIMAKASSARGGGSSRGSSGSSSRGASSRASSNSRMWSQPATPRQISALKANGNYDGKYYSKGRAGQTIGESVRTAGSAAMASGGSHAGRAQLATPVLSVAPATGPTRSGALELAPLLGEIVAVSPSTPPLPEPAARTGVDASGPLSFALFDELEERHLRAYRAEHSSNWGGELRREVSAWAELRVKLVQQRTAALADLVAILDGAPAGALPDPAATAWQLLGAASPYGLEEQHLRSYQREHSSNWGRELRRELEAWRASRIALAQTNAHALVAMLNQQARLAPSPQPPALPAATGQDATPGRRRGQDTARSKAPRNGTARSGRSGKGKTYLATVASINPHGAVVSLDSGERGWLHVTQLRALNGGARVASVSDVLRLGQTLHTRSIGTTDRGEVRLTLVEAKPAKQRTDAAPPPTQASDATPRSAAEAPRGLLGRLAAGRIGKEQP